MAKKKTSVTAKGIIKQPLNPMIYVLISAISLLVARVGFFFQLPAWRRFLGN